MEIGEGGRPDKEFANLEGEDERPKGGGGSGRSSSRWRMGVERGWATLGVRGIALRTVGIKEKRAERLKQKND